ncbi:MAG: RDD family protein [Archangium sp.]|nr:RDD family protein [Archangium sp.]
MAETAPLRLDGLHTVRTPEFVEFDFVLAGLVSRGVALAIDTLLTIVLSLAIIIATSLALGGLAPPFIFIIWFLTDWGTLMAFEAAWNGQTPGKRAMGLRVLQESGVRVGPWQAVLRNLARPVDKLPLLYLVGGLSALFSQRHQRLGDVWAGTIVVRERRLEIPAALPTPSVDAATALDVRFFDRVAKFTAEEENVVVSAALRREELIVDARLALFGRLAAWLRDTHGLLQPPHVSDEKLVTLVAGAVVARRSARAGPAPLRNTSRR